MKRIGEREDEQMSKRKGDDDDDEEPMRSQLSRLDLSGVKRKPEDGDTERKQQRKAIRQIESPYEALRRDLILANPVAALGGPSLLDAKRHSFLDHVIVMINLNDEAGLMNMLDQEPLEPAMADSVFRAVVRSNMLSVIVKMAADYPQVDLEAAVQDGIRHPSCKVPTMKLLMTLWADEHGETIQAAAKQMLEKVGKDADMLRLARLRALQEMANIPVLRWGLEKPADMKAVAGEVDDRIVELPAQVSEHIWPDDEIRCDGIDTELAYTPNGKYLLVSIVNREGFYDSFGVKVLDAEDLGRVVSDWDMKNVEARSIEPAPDDKTVYVSGANRIRVFEIGKPDAVRDIQVARFSADRRHGIQTAALSPDGKFIAVGGQHGHVSVVDVATGHVIRELNMVHPSTHKLRYSFDGIFLLGCSGPNDRPGTMWDTRTWEQSQQLSNVIDIASSPVEPLFATLSERGLVEIWNPVTRKAIRRFQVPLVSSPYSVQFSPKGTRVIVMGKTLTVIDWAARAVVYSVESGTRFDLAAMSPVDYRLIVAAVRIRDELSTYDFRGRDAVKSLRESVSSGLANSAQPQSPWDVFLTRGLYDPRLLLGIMAFATKF